MYNAEGIIIVWYASTRATSIRPERITRGAKFRRMFPVRFTKNKVGSCQVPVGDTTVSNCHAVERGSSWNCWLHFVSSPRFEMSFVAMFVEQATPPFTRVSNLDLALHYRYTLIILDTDSIPFFLYLLRFVKLSNEQF